jgi:hypothetical protein
MTGRRRAVTIVLRMALEAVKGRRTVIELGTECEVHPTQIS